MKLRKFLTLTLIIALLLLAGCVIQEPVTAKEEHFPMFEKRFNVLPDSITASPWKTARSGEDTIHTTVLSCKKQHSCALELIVNSDGRVVSISLQNESADDCDSCFAELSFHAYCAMGFNDIDAKGNQSFADVDGFYNYFGLHSNQLCDGTEWINRYEVKHTYLPELKTQSFTIIHNRTPAQTFHESEDGNSTQP